MKKKKDGLIKGMIAAAIIFVVGFILTVCFGAYLGADAVRSIASGDTFEEFVEERFPNIDFDEGQTVNESQTEMTDLFHYAPYCSAAIDYELVINELFNI